MEKIGLFDQMLYVMLNDTLKEETMRANGFFGWCFQTSFCQLNLLFFSDCTEFIFLSFRTAFDKQYLKINQACLPSLFTVLDH